MWRAVALGVGALTAVGGGAIGAAFALEYSSKRTSATHSVGSAFQQWLIHWVMWLLGSSRAKRFARLSERFHEENEDFLLELVRQQEASAYGKAHGFAAVKTVEEYLSSQPLTRYDAYAEYVEALVRGEKDQLTVEKNAGVKKLSMTSGTSGHAKLLPFSKKQGTIFFMEGITIIYEAMFSRIPGSFNLQKTAKIMFTPTSRTSPGGLSIGPASSAPADAKSLMCMYAIPAIAYEARREDSALYLYALFALKERELGTLEGNFAFLIHSLMRTIEERHQQLVEDIRTGRLDVELDLDISLRERINALISPDPSRAKELEAEFAKGMDDIGCRVWPRLTTVLTVTTGAFEVYKKSLESYIDPSTVAYYSPLYAASEGLIGVNLDPKSSTYTLVPRAMFYEFIPVAVSHEAQPKTLRSSELVAGEDYELVITTVSGLHRYRFGDVIRFVRYARTAPVVEFRYRMGQLLDVRGEKTSECAMYDALAETMRHLGLHLVDYTCAPFVEDGAEKRDTVSPFYILFIEVEEDITVSTTVVASLLDAALAKSNPIYATFRERGSIDELSLHFVKQGSFETLRAELVKAGGVGQQTKIPRVLRRQKDIQWMHSNTLA